MTTFLDGPAEGMALMLRRAPRYLRVTATRHADHLEWDALDQLEDQPRPGETLYAYEIEGEAGVCHIYRRGGGSGWYAHAQYRWLADEQPDDATMRDSIAWRQWCLVRAEKVSVPSTSPMKP